MVSCENFCTVEKCQELEQLIQELELKIILLESQISDLSNLVNNHLDLNIPQAHKYEPSVLVDVFELANQTAIIKVSVDGNSDEDTLLLPTFEPDVLVDVFEQDNSAVIKVSVNGDSDEDTLLFSNNDQHIESNLKGSAILTGDTLLISIADGESQDTFSVNLPYLTEQDLPPTEQLPVNLELSIEGNTLNAAVDVGDYSDWAFVELPEINLPVNLELGIEGNTLNAAVDVGDYSDWAFVELPIFEPEVLVDVFEQGEGTAVIKVSVNGDSDEDTLFLPTFEPSVLVDVFEQDNSAVIKVSVNYRSSYYC